MLEEGGRWEGSSPSSWQGKSPEKGTNYSKTARDEVYCNLSLFQEGAYIHI